MEYGMEERPFKIILCGRKGVGKTTLLRLLSEVADPYDDNSNDPLKSIKLQSNRDSTASQLSKVTLKTNCKGKTVKAEVWDTGSLEAHGGSHTVTKSYYRDSHAAILIYVTGNEESKTELLEWAKTVLHNSPNCVLSLWCNNRSREFGSSVLTRDMIDAFAQKYNIDQNKSFMYIEGDVYSVHTHLQTLIKELVTEKFASPITDSIKLTDYKATDSWRTSSINMQTCLSCMKSS